MNKRLVHMYVSIVSEKIYSNNCATNMHLKRATGKAI